MNCGYLGLLLGLLAAADYLTDEEATRLLVDRQFKAERLPSTPAELLDIISRYADSY